MGFSNASPASLTIFGDMSSGPVALFVLRLANFLSMAKGDSAMLLTQGTILVDVARSDRHWGWKLPASFSPMLEKKLLTRFDFSAMPLACTIMSGLHLHVTGPDENTDNNLMTISCFLPKKYFSNGKFTASAFFNKHCTF